MLFSGQDVPINAITSRTQRLLRHVIDSDSRLMGYTLRVTELRRSIPRFERNETSGEIEIGCLLRVRQSNHDEMVVSVVAEAGQRFFFFQYMTTPDLLVLLEIYNFQHLEKVLHMNIFLRYGHEQ